MQPEAQHTLFIPLAGTEAILAKRYALALFALANEKEDYALADGRQAVAAVAEELAGLRQLAAESADFRQIIADPRIGRSALGVALQQVAAQGKLGKITSNLLGLLAQNRRASLLPAIAAAFAAERARRLNEITATVTAAQPLTEAQQKQLADKLAAATGATIKLSLRTDSALIGGFTVAWGSQRIDASLQGRLRSLKQYLQQEAA